MAGGGADPEKDRDPVQRRRRHRQYPSGLTALLRSIPRQEVIDAGDLVVRNAGEGIGEPRLRIDTVELVGLDEGIGDGRGAAAGERSYEEVILPAQGDGSHGTLGRIVVELEDAVVEVGPKSSHAAERVADRDGQRRLAGDARQLRMQPGLEIVEDRLRLRLPDLDALIRRRTEGQR